MPWFHPTAASVLVLLLSACQAVAPVPVSQSPAVPSPVPSPVPSVVPSPNPSPVSPLASDTSIWFQLRQGRGYVMLFRHALAPGTGDPANFRLDDCTTQRNLSAEGRQQAIRMGEALRQQGVVVSRVLSSQWCRCLETARLMNVGAVESFPVLNSFFQNRSTEDTQTEQLRQFILENRENPGVVILVTHQVNITALSDIVPESGAAVVMRASELDQIELVGQVDPL